MKAHYDDPDFFYEDYWQNRDYEHQSEIVAFKKLLDGKHFAASADIGGGYGRLTSLLSLRSDQVYLIEPSNKQRQIATKYLENIPNAQIINGTCEKTTLPANSLDLAVVVRVSHHLPDLNPALVELARVIKPGGYLIFDIANSIHFKSRLKSLVFGKSISKSPIERRSEANIHRKTIDFVNHHPEAVLELLKQAGFESQKILSVSNFRHRLLKKLIPLPLLLNLESIFQNIMAHLYFGPSIFVFAKKV